MGKDEDSIVHNFHYIKRKEVDGVRYAVCTKCKDKINIPDFVYDEERFIEIYFKRLCKSKEKDGEDEDSYKRGMMNRDGNNTGDANTTMSSDGGFNYWTRFGEEG